MAEMIPGQQQSPLPPISQLMQMYDPKQLQMLAQGVATLLKVQQAMAPQPDPRQAIMQPGPMEQLAMLELAKRKREMMAQQMPQQAAM